MISLLLVVLILGVISVKAIDGTNVAVVNTASTTTEPGTGVTTSTPGVPLLALRAQCNSDAQALVTAVQTYEAQNFPSVLGTESGITFGMPTSYPRGHDAQALMRTGLVSTWPVSSAFSISMSTTRALDVSIYVPTTSRKPMSWLGQGATSGCNAIG